MTELQDATPSFDRPPIVEKLMGIEFSPLEKWEVPHFGLFWQEIRDSYPTFTVQPPLLAPQTEFISAGGVVRCWFHHESKTKLIQVQQDRFLYNWQKPNTYETYPHHESIQPEFAEMWQKFCQFLEANEIGVPMINQCEITYINHLERGREWQKLSDLPNIINCWSNLSGNLLNVEPDLVAIQTSYSMPDIEGKLIIQIQPAFDHESAKEILLLRLTASGKPTSFEAADLLSWFEAGRKCVVQSFVDLTSQEMHEFWGRKS